MSLLPTERQRLSTVSRTFTNSNWSTLPRPKRRLSRTIRPGLGYDFFDALTPALNRH
jgi:hypothetical protein